MNKRVSMQTIADELGVSKVTVYRALKDRYGVGEELRMKIENYAKSVGYAETKKSSQKLKNLAFLSARKFFFDGEEHYHSVFAELSKVCEENRQRIKVFKISEEEEEAIRIPADLSAGKYAGVFLAGSLRPAYVEALLALGIPVVAIDFDTFIDRVDSILVDNYALGTAATKQLIAAGHRAIGFIGNPRSDKNITDRYFGYLKALYLADIAFEPGWQTCNNDIDTSLYTTNFPLPDPLPTAFLCYCDCAAYYLIERLKMEGVRVPEDVSVISFDNTNLAVKTTPKLTSVHVDKQDLAQLAHSAMMQRAANPGLHIQKIYLRGRLIERDSVRQR